MEDLAAHPTVKPLRLAADALKDVTAPGEIVLDSFAGSGTTILAADGSGGEPARSRSIPIRRYRRSPMTDCNGPRRRSSGNRAHLR